MLLVQTGGRRLLRRSSDHSFSATQTIYARFRIKYCRVGPCTLLPIARWRPLRLVEYIYIEHVRRSGGSP